MSTPTGDGAHAAGNRPQVGDDTPRLATPGTGQGAHQPGHHHNDLEAGREQRRDPNQNLDRHNLDRHNLDRESVLEREKNAHGGVKIGSAFFGWLTATGTAVLLTALLAATGTAMGLANSGGLDQAVSGAQDSASSNAATIGLAGGIAVLVVLLVAYFCGGYVAGRMARFNGVKQGIAVWAWAIVIAVVVAVAAAIAGSKFDVLGQLNSFPRIPVDAGSLTTGSIIALVAAVVVALLGAILGGLAGMRFHRRVDRAGLGR